MRKLFARLAVSAMLAIAAAPAGAVTLTASGTLGVAIGALPAVTVGGSPAPILVSSGSGDFTQPVSMFSAAVVLPTQLFTGVSLISSLNVTVANASMAVSGGTGNAGLNGTAIVGVLGGLINLLIPLSPVGAGGVISPAAAGLMITVTGHNWTTGVGAVTGLSSATPLGGFTNTVTLAGSDTRTAGHQGSILLVSPFRVMSGATGTLTGFATQLLTFVPEPGTLLLIGSGVACVALVGRKRMQK